MFRQIIGNAKLEAKDTNSAFHKRCPNMNWLIWDQAIWRHELGWLLVTRPSMSCTSSPYQAIAIVVDRGARAQPFKFVIFALHRQKKLC